MMIKFVPANAKMPHILYLATLFIVAFFGIPTTATAAVVCAKRPTLASCLTIQHESGSGIARISDCTGGATEFVVTSKCSSTESTYMAGGSPAHDNAADNKYCWCKLISVDGMNINVQYRTTFSKSSGYYSEQNTPPSGWVFAMTKASSSACLTSCTYTCAEHAGNVSDEYNYRQFRTALFNAAGIN